MNKFVGFLCVVAGLLAVAYDNQTPGDQFIFSLIGGALVGVGIVGLILWD